MQEFQRRLVIAYVELERKTENLTAYMCTPEFVALSAEEQTILARQLNAMTDYYKVVGERLVSFKLFS